MAHKISLGPQTIDWDATDPSMHYKSSEPQLGFHG